MRQTFLILSAVALVAAAGGYMLARALNPAAAPETVPGSYPSSEAIRLKSASELVGQKRPDFTLSDSEGAVVSASDFDGQVWLANFWATWCKPCVEEMPMLSRLQQDHAAEGFSVIGIALDDPDRAREFAAAMDLQYPVLLGRADVVITSRQYGNTTGMLPFSVLVDANGTIRWTHLGALNEKELKTQIQALR